MTINDLRMDIIAAVSQSTDVEVLEKIRAELDPRDNDGDNTSPWKGANTELRTGVSFADLMREQRYAPVTFEEFTNDPLEDDWEVSLDDLLALSKPAA